MTDDRAIKLRYNIPVHISSQVSKTGVSDLTQQRASSPADRSRRDSAPKIDFDPMSIAKKGEGWDDMLQRVLLRWIMEVSREIREGNAL